MSAALAEYAALGLPHTGLESWRKTSLAHWAGQDWPLAPCPSSDLAPLLPAAPQAFPAPHDGLAWLNLAHAQPNYGRVAAGSSVQWHWQGTCAANSQSHQRSQIIVEAGAELALHWHCALAPQALLTQELHLLLHEDAEASVVLYAASPAELACVRQRLIAEVGPCARLQVISVDTGAKPSRRELEVNLAGTAAEFDGRSLLLAQGRHSDATWQITHSGTHTVSRLKMRVLAAAKGRAVAHPTVIVKPSATGTDTETRIASLLADSTAEVSAKPILRIDTNEVRAAHGATYGQLDAAALFYLQARGVPAAEARKLLLHSFVASLWEGLPADVLSPLQASADAAIAEWPL